MSLFDHMNIFGDLATNHRGDEKVFSNLCQEIIKVGAIPKIQLWSKETFPREWRHHLVAIPFVPSVFRPEDVDFILPYKPLALKVASVEATYWELVKRCCQEDLPLIVSTGGMDDQELMELSEITCDHAPGVCIMHCVSLYPTPKEQINLGRLAALSEAFEDSDVVIGWSSHYPVVDPAAFALAWAWGATQYEVHVRPPWSMPRSGEITLDEQCAFDVEGLKQIRTVLENLPTLEGSEDYAGPDRDFVVQHRARWQR